MILILKVLMLRIQRHNCSLINLLPTLLLHTFDNIISSIEKVDLSLYLG